MLAKASALTIDSFAFTLFITLLSVALFLIKDIISVSPLGPRAIIVSAAIYLFLLPSLSIFMRIGRPLEAICSPKLAIATQAAALTFQ